MIPPTQALNPVRSVDPKYPTVLFGQSYVSFMKSMKRNAPVTKTRYSKKLADFLIAHQSTSEDFYHWIIDHKNPEDARDDDALETLLTNYYNLLLTRKENPLKFSTVLMSVKAVNHFLRGNKEDIHYFYEPSILSTEMFNAKVIPEGQDKIDREDVNTLLGCTANPQYKAILMVLKDTGLRADDLRFIQYKHIRKALAEPAPDFITFELLPQKNRYKSKIPANPVLGPDAIKYVRLWVKHKKALYKDREAYEVRMNRKGRFKPDPKPHTYSDEDEDYLFCYTETKQTYTTDAGITIPGKEFGQRYSKGAISQAVNTIKRNFREMFTKKSAHSFRKSHTTGLTAARVPERWVNVMQGRRGEGTMGIYQKPNDKELIKAFKSGYHEISLELRPDQEMIALAKTVEEQRVQLEQQAEELRVNNLGFQNQLDEVKKEMAEYTKKTE